jgi:clan AA aspartic protease (TIGR02281 family)
VPFLGIAWMLIALVALVPGLINSRLLMLLLLALSILGVVILLLHMMLRGRDNRLLADALYPIAGLLLVLGVVLHQEIGALGRGIVGFAMPSGSLSEGMRFARGEDEGFHVTLTIDGAAVDFVVDPSVAYNVMMPDVPKQIGINPASLTYDRQIEPGAGEGAYVAEVTLHKIRLGDAVIDSLPVKVFADGRARNTLGKPFLDSLKAWEIEDDTLFLVQ